MFLSPPHKAIVYILDNSAKPITFKSDLLYVHGYHSINLSGRYYYLNLLFNRGTVNVEMNVLNASI